MRLAAELAYKKINEVLKALSEQEVLKREGSTNFAIVDRLDYLFGFYLEYYHDIWSTFFLGGEFRVTEEMAVNVATGMSLADAIDCAIKKLEAVNETLVQYEVFTDYSDYVRETMRCVKALLEMKDNEDFAEVIEREKFRKEIELVLLKRKKETLQRGK